MAIIKRIKSFFKKKPPKVPSLGSYYIKPSEVGKAGDKGIVVSGGKDILGQVPRGDIPRGKVGKRRRGGRGDGEKEKEVITIKSAYGKPIPISQLDSGFLGKKNGFVSYGPGGKDFVFVGGEAVKKTEVPKVLVENILRLEKEGKEFEILLGPSTYSESELSPLIEKELMEEKKVVSPKYFGSTDIEPSVFGPTYTGPRAKDSQITTAGNILSFFVTKPKSLTEIKEKDMGIISGGFELTKFGFIQPFAGIAETFKTSGAELKTEDFFGSKVLGTTFGGIGTLLPETPATVGLYAVGGKLLTMAPPVIRAGVGSYVAYAGGKTALDISLTPEERVAGGIVFGLGAIGTASEVYPFIKGGIARLSPKYKGIQTKDIMFKGKEFEVQVIRGVGKETKFDIGIIPEKTGWSVKQGQFEAGSGALVRGGFGFTPSEQMKGFSGKTLRLTTSQRGLQIKEGMFKVSPEVSEYGFFYTPADPITKMPQTRISRLGLVDFFKFPPKTDSGISYTKMGRPQIIVTEPVKLGDLAKITPKGSTELEVTVLSNIKVLGKGGVTALKGQKVDIYLGELTKIKPTALMGGKLKVGDIVSSTAPTTRFISPTTLISAPAGFKMVSEKSYEIPKPSYSFYVAPSKPITKLVYGETYKIPAQTKPYSPLPYPTQYEPRYKPTPYKSQLLPSKQTYYPQSYGAGYPSYKSFISPIIILPGMPQKTERISMERLFKRIPSFAALEFGKVGKEKPEREYSGLFERPLLKPLKETKLTLPALGPIKVSIKKKVKKKKNG